MCIDFEFYEANDLEKTEEFKLFAFFHGDESSGRTIIAGHLPHDIQKELGWTESKILISRFLAQKARFHHDLAYDVTKFLRFVIQFGAIYLETDRDDRRSIVFISSGYSTNSKVIYVPARINGNGNGIFVRSIYECKIRRNKKKKLKLLRPQTYYTAKAA